MGIIFRPSWKHWCAINQAIYIAWKFSVSTIFKAHFHLGTFQLLRRFSTRRNFSIEPKFLLFKFKRFLFSSIWVLVRQKKISIRSKKSLSGKPPLNNDIFGKFSVHEKWALTVWSPFLNLELPSSVCVLERQTPQFRCVFLHADDRVLQLLSQHCRVSRHE